MNHMLRSSSIHLAAQMIITNMRIFGHLAAITDTLADWHFDGNEEVTSARTPFFFLI